VFPFKNGYTKRLQFKLYLHNMSYYIHIIIIMIIIINCNWVVTRWQ